MSPDSDAARGSLLFSALPLSFSSTLTLGLAVFAPVPNPFPAMQTVVWCAVDPFLSAATERRLGSRHSCVPPNALLLLQMALKVEATAAMVVRPRAVVVAVG